MLERVPQEVDSKYKQQNNKSAQSVDVLKVFFDSYLTVSQISESKITFLRVEFLSNRCIQTQILKVKSLFRIKSKSEMEILRVKYSLLRVDDIAVNLL